MTTEALLTMLIVQLTVTIITARFLLKIFKSQANSKNHREDGRPPMPL